MQLFFQLHQELVDNTKDDFVIERLEGNDGIEPVAKFRGEDALDVDHLVAALTRGGEAHRCLLQRFLPGVGRHNDDHVAKIGFAPVVVGQRAVVHHLQQDAVDVRVRFFDFVQQQHAVGFFSDGFGELPALIEPDVARRSSDQAGDRMALHVFGHVEAQQFDAQAVGELFGDFGLADAGRA